MSNRQVVATVVLDKQCDDQGLMAHAADATDWSDVKHSLRKKRDRLLDDNVVLSLCTKSDWEGFKRLLTNCAILICTAKTTGFIWGESEMIQSSAFHFASKYVLFPALYMFYGFQIQCFGYAAQHELMHRTAFRTRWINDTLLFLVSIPCFEFGKHEKAMHKQHHTYTNDIHRDPELTSFWDREELENKGFRKVAANRWEYVLEFIDLASVMKSHLMRIINSSRGIPVDYTGTKWSLENWRYGDEVMRDLQVTAQFQIGVYLIILALPMLAEKGMKELLFYWLIPAILGFIPINFVRNAEHADCFISKQGDEINCLRNTRSCRSNFIVRHLMWNMNFHAEHHLYPMVPFYNLPKLSDLLEESLEHNDIKHFLNVNWEYVKRDGWIDQQNKESGRTADDSNKKLL
mmetsp:Transcript_15059/g.22228  ORF Transcript_15059/g.22228 Transcript_15059/m.22228 type:complete len:404 (-) Transcript_15059:237-1448(-)|eukprot:CAMPEP_0116008084 /NCGR_PEP_ID=MMETSP0321-20121206/2663_1 /TAXON_ID=163516 /ORGANISM="Leptocylindrus danicus var. danicus, Strain B650" /LENGTH=403 /DNA_ID=CAMNT_0003476861 /DNA_START=15 /DNA_END=1226 /DNA_ORIENTATION=+